MEITIYKPEDKEAWDDFIRNSKNGTFLFLRDFMEYHQHRFSDCSLLFYDADNKLIAVMPGNIRDNIFYTHQGLTYGGLVMAKDIKMQNVLDIFDTLVATMSKQGIKKIIYKSIPHIYHSSPAEEDLYALFRHNAILIERSISSAIFCPSQTQEDKTPVHFTNELFCTQESDDFEAFWNILSNNLQQRYGKQPVHSLEEIVSLKQAFPHDIRLFCTYYRKKLVAGCVIFETDEVAHVQYSSTSSKGRQIGALNNTYNSIIHTIFSKKNVFDFGISTEEQGTYLNNNLISYKEGFGARGIVYDTYVINL